MFFYRQTISVSMWYFLNTTRAACGQWSDTNSTEDLHIRKINYDTKTAGNCKIQFDSFIKISNCTDYFSGVGAISPKLADICPHPSKSQTTRAYLKGTPPTKKEKYSLEPFLVDVQFSHS